MDYKSSRRAGADVQWNSNQSAQPVAASSDSTDEIRAYLGDMTAQLETIAKSANFVLLAGLLGIARAEAESLGTDPKDGRKIEHTVAQPEGSVRFGSRVRSNSETSSGRGPASVLMDLSTTAPTSSIVSFGSVTIQGDPPAPEVFERNVAAGQAALKRVLAALSKPGITLDRVKGVPYYHYDSDDPAVLIRELDGRVQRGTFADGEFKPTE